MEVITYWSFYIRANVDQNIHLPSSKSSSKKITCILWEQQSPQGWIHTKTHIDMHYQIVQSKVQLFSPKGYVTYLMVWIKYGDT